MTLPIRHKLDNETLVELISDALHLIVVHYGLWLWETEHQLGLDKAIEADNIAWQRLLPIFMGRLAQRFGVETTDGSKIPQALAGADHEQLVALLEDMGKNWLASDGVWFQAVEQHFDTQMVTAKRINDSCWMKFSYIEAQHIKRRLGLGERGGIAALKEAIQYRLYGLVNRQETIDEDDGRLIFRMNECRVQVARKRAGLPDYPCKSAGLVEYSRFAEGIDSRLVTRCVGCPPDEHPDDWYCAWEFSLSPGI